MAERYTRLFSLPENLYTEGAPVLVAAGALLRDNMTDTVLAQLKLKNIGEGEICAVTVLVNSFDPAGRPLGEPVRHSYLDLCAKRDGEFGQKNLAALPDKTARSYTVAVTEVVFWDGRVWTGTDAPWQPFEKQKTLAEALGDIQLAEQYSIEVGAFYELAPVEQSDLWLCACGGVNRESEPVCHSCRLKKENAFGALDKETLKTKLSARLAEEAAEAERKRLEAEKRRKEQERNAELARLERAEKAKKLGKGALIVLAAAIVCAAVVLFVTKVIPSVKNKKAAYEKYGKVLSSAMVDDIIVFGTYEQDNDTSNGKEDIEWRVLVKEDNRILVISEMALECQPYNTTSVDVTWESCSLHQWMNETFLNDAFSEEEQAIIQSTTVSADKNPEFNTNPGNDTTDKVFLLSITEAEEYFTSDEYRKCVPTEYAIEHGASTSNSYTKAGIATCFCWLRSPGYVQISAARVDRDGSVYYRGLGVDIDYVCVRPAMWINLDS